MPETTSAPSTRQHLSPAWAWKVVTPLALLLAAACNSPEPAQAPTETPTTPATATAPAVRQPLVSSQPVIAASVPGKVVVAPDGRAFYTEVFKGRIRIYENGEKRTFVEFDTFAVGECGLIGLELDPDFEDNHYVYAYVVERIEGRDDVGHPVLRRFTEVDGQATEPKVIVGDLPNTNPEVCAHVGGGIAFGPDGSLYLSVGELELKTPAQELGSPLGKVLRIRKSDGSPAPDNPFIDDADADPRVFVYGLRNPYDLAFNPQTGGLYGTENGPSNCDEINIYKAGEYYGHPESYTDDPVPCLERPGFPPVYLPHKPDVPPEVFGSNVAPTGMTFVSGERYPSLGDSLLYCEWNTGFMRRLVLAGEGQDRVVDDSIIVEDCKLDVTVGPHGIVYYSNAEQIRRLMPYGGLPD